MALTYRAAHDPDARSLSELAHRTLLPHTLPGWTSAAVERLLGENSDERLREFLKRAAFAHVCCDAPSIVGFIACRMPPLISLLVVDPSHQRQGIGSTLLDIMLAHVATVAPEISVVEVNATEYSFPFYRSRGFHPISEFIDFEGCRFARMAFWRRNPLLAR